MFDFSGQRILIIGGSSGMGLATAKLAAALGAHITIASRSEVKLEAAKKALPSEVAGRVLDVTNDRGVEEFFGDGTIWDHVVLSGP